jgi:nitrite reductase (NADH) small subunit
MIADVHWVRITTTDAVPPREGRAVRIGSRDLALFNVGSAFLATDNRCPHSGGPLCDGIVTGTSVVCPLHAWKVNLITGAVERPSANHDRRIETYPTQIVDGVVMIGIPVAAARADDDRLAPVSVAKLS